MGSDGLDLGARFTVDRQKYKGFHAGDHDHTGDDCPTCGDPATNIQKRRGKRSKRKVPERTKPMRWRSLHHHSTFSFLDGYQLPDAHARRAAEVGMQGFALTEHGNVSSHVKLEQAATTHGIDPIFGVELYCGAVDEENRTQRKNHLTVLAESQDGYRNLMRLVTQSWKDTYYEPTTSGATLKQYREGLVVLSGCTGSLLATSLIGGKNIDEKDASYERGLALAKRFKRTFGDAYYLEVQCFPELQSTRTLNPMIARISQETGIPLVATGDVHYTDPTEAEVQAILHNIRGGTRQTLEQQAQAWGYDVPLAPPVTDKDIFRRLVATGLTRQQARDSILATEEIAQRCAGVVLPKAQPLRFPLPQGETRDGYWKKLLRDGWRYRRIHELPARRRQEYKARLQRELDIIEGKEFQDYFMIVSDLVTYAKDNGIPVGPARGSAAASLVCFLLRITEVDPVIFENLVFERFIDHSRMDLPDIDLDFDSDRRHEIKEYAERRYGTANVGLIGTFTMFKAKNSLDDIGRVYRIPQFEVDQVKDVLIYRTMGDLRGDDTIADTVAQYDHAQAVFERHPDLEHAMDLEGQVKGLGAHAGGLIISQDPISEVAAVYRKKVKDELNDVIGWDKYDVERQGLIKIDVLGLNTMSVISEVLALTGLTLEDLNDLDLADPNIIDGFHRADVIGIFQFDGRTMRDVTRELKPESFAEVADINALARPGPLHNGATQAYIELKHGRKQPEKVHPLLDVITQDTHSQIVYQEQILRIVREIGDFDWTGAAHIRKIISKKMGEQEFAKQFDAFWAGASNKPGMTREMAEDIWKRCITAGAYAFNAAHSVSYGMLAWWCMYFKVYHPEEFYVAALRKMGEAKHPDLLKDAHAHGIELLPPHPTKSGPSWNVEGKGKIRGGLVQVKGIGPKMAPRMIEWRERNPVKTWDDYQAIKGVGPATIEKIQEFAADEDPYRIHWLRNRVQLVRDNTQKLGLPRITHWADEIPYAATGENVAVVWAGVITHRNLRDLFELHYSRTGEQLDPETVRDPQLRQWVVMQGTDDTDQVTVSCSRWLYPQYKKSIWNIDLDKDVVVVRGTKLGNQARRAIYVDSMWIVDPDS